MGGYRDMCLKVPFILTYINLQISFAGDRLVSTKGVSHHPTLRARKSWSAADA